MIKKRCILILLLLIFLVKPAYGEYKEKIYDDWLDTGKSFTTNNKTFTIGIDEFTDSASVNFNGFGLIIYRGVCEDIANLSICINSLNVSYRNNTLYKDIYKAKIVVYSYLPKLEVTRTTEDTELMMGEKTGIDLVIKNTGSLIANDIEYLEEFKDFDILDMTGCYIRGKSVVWTGSLLVDREAKCSWKIKANKRTSFKTNASVTYFDGEKTKTLSPSPISINVQDYSLKILFNLSKDKLEVGETSNLSIRLRNNHSSEVLSNIYFYLDIPNGLEVLEKKRLTKQDKTYTWRGSLEPDEEKKLFILLKGKNTDKYSIESYARFDIDSLTKRTDKTEMLEIYLDNLEISFKITNKTLSPLEKTNIKVYAVNPNNGVFNDISTFINSNIVSISMETIEVDEIIGKSNYKLIDVDFTAPNISHEYFISINASYKTMFGQKFNSYDIEHINVVLPEAEDQILNITQNISIEETETSANITQQENFTTEYSGLNESDEGLDEEKSIRKLLPSLNLKEITYKLKQNLSKVIFILVDIVIILLIIFVILKIKREKSR